MRVVVTGGRDYENREAVRHELAELCLLRSNPLTAVAHGACQDHLGRLQGADRWADEVARELGLEVRRYSVEVAVDGPWPAAGPRRNRRMLLAERPGLVVAFPGGSGTASCVRVALALGIPVRKIAEGYR